MQSRLRFVFCACPLCMQRCVPWVHVFCLTKGILFVGGARILWGLERDNLHTPAQTRKLSMVYYIIQRFGGAGHRTPATIPMEQALGPCARGPRPPKRVLKVVVTPLEVYTCMPLISPCTLVGSSA